LGGLPGLDGFVLKHGKYMLLNLKSYSIGETGIASYDSVWICDIWSGSVPWQSRVYIVGWKNYSSTSVSKVGIRTNCLC
jgi:hypothetical protein